MEHKYLAVPWGGRVVTEDGWSGRLMGAYLAPRSQQISHVMIRRGFPGRPQQAKLENARQDADGTLMLPSQKQDSATPARGSVPFTAKTVVHCSGGVSLPLRGLVLDRQRLRVEYLLVGTGGDAWAVPMHQVDKLASGSPSVALSKADIEKLPVFRPDAEAHCNALAALAQADITQDIFAAVQVQVTDGMAYLTGNVRLTVQKAEAEKAVASARGVLNVQNAVAADWDLSIAIAQAMAQEGLTRQGLVTVKSLLGRVRLSGHLATQELVDSAEAVAAEVAGVRSVAHDIQVRPLPAPEPAAVAEATGH
ncbi:MAG: BON domain-containing protein [Dehalococcoidia bacterium]|nr:BON domain-containing protein [Dehalococcoidia bacterium]